jgi:hypothetical protein
VTLRVPGTHNSILVLDRVFAHQWPYDPVYKDAPKHPSRAFFFDCDYLHVPDIRLRTLRLVLPKLRREAEATLVGHDVRHLEVQVVAVEDTRHPEHIRAGCPACDWLYYTEYSDGYLVGWYAVIKKTGDDRGDEHGDPGHHPVPVPG